MNPTPVRLWLLAGVGFVLLLVRAPSAGAQAPGSQGVSPATQRAAGKCALCHTTLLAAWQRSPHGGAKPVSCTACHPAGLLRGSPLPPENAARVCGKCHAMGWENSPHAKAGVSCLACHGLHRSAAAPLLKRRADALCLSCHAKGGSFLHQNAAAREKRRANCASCHEPHRGVKLTAGGEAWHLKKAVTHRPVAEGKCNACHQVHQAPLLPGQSAALDEDVDEPEAGPSGGPNRSLLSQPPATICYECHGEKKELFLRTKHTRAGQWARPPRDNACAACHLPHGSDYAQLTTYDGSLLCLTCHPEKTPHHFLAVAGVRLAKLACGECHNPHGTPHPALLVRDRRDICGQCHRK